MSIVQFPARPPAGAAERVALRRGVVPVASRFGAALQLVQRQGPAVAYCAGCAAQIDFGAVWKGDDAFCSFECSIGGDRPA